MNESIIRNATVDDLAKVYQDFTSDQMLWAVERLLALSEKLEIRNSELEHDAGMVDDLECDISEKEYEIEALEDKIERIKEILGEV